MKTMRFLAAAFAAMVCLMACEEPLPPEEEKVPATISVSPASVTFEAEGGTLKVAVTTNVADYSVGTAPDWLTIEKSGKELSLTAQPNKVKETRSASIKLSAEDASCTLEVSQKLGSPYLGYTMMKEATMEYSGTLLYQFLKPSAEDYGGTAYLILTDEDENVFTSWIYTDLFESEDQVELTQGKYTKGTDNYPTSIVAEKLTYMPGTVGVISDEEDDEEFFEGTYVTYASGEMALLVDGTIEVFEEGGETVIKVDMKDKNGNDYKMVYMGEVAINTEGAGYPSSSDRVDLAATLFGADCYFYGDKYENGTSNFQLVLYSGDEENPATTIFEFNTDAVEFSEDMDISGEYDFPMESEEEGVEAIELYSAGTVIPGSMLEMFGFEFPMGTYAMYAFDDVVLADEYAFLSLEKQEDGTYSINGSIMASTGDFVMFFGINDLEINLYDGTEFDEEEDW